MSEQRFELRKYGDSWEVYDNETFDCYTIHNVSDLLNEQQALIEHLKKRLYDFEKRKIIEESEIDEDVIPKVKLLRTELFGEKYE